MQKVIFDLDDFACDDKNCLLELIELRDILPHLKVTLFTIPKKIDPDLLEIVKTFDWIELAVHGFNHESNYEFSKLTKEEAKALILKGFDERYFVKGFKAPGWQISEGTMEALKELGFWVAVQWGDGRLLGDPNGPYQPAVIDGLPYYAFREHPGSIHGHTWECCGNGIKALWPELIKLPPETEFQFISELFK